MQSQWKQVHTGCLSAVSINSYILYEVSRDQGDKVFYMEPFAFSATTASLTVSQILSKYLSLKYKILTFVADTLNPEIL